MDAQVVVVVSKLLSVVVFEAFVGIVGEDDFFSTCSTVGAGLCLVESTQSEGADVAGAVVAGSDTLVDDWRGADEADLGLNIITVLGLR
jgi:hypothetical protein